jgi:transcriptional regulator with AAA-type ATPase domain
MSYDWPGNIRQFENSIEHAVAMSLTPPKSPASASRRSSLRMQSGSLMPGVSIPDEGLNFTSIVSQLERD